MALGFAGEGMEKWRRGEESPREKPAEEDVDALAAAGRLLSVAARALLCPSRSDDGGARRRLRPTAARQEEAAADGGARSRLKSRAWLQIRECLLGGVAPPGSR